MNSRRSFITGIKSTTLSVKEKQFLQQYKPWGVILFSRNIKTILQTKKLTDEIKKIFKDENYPILIDQEGGRINRFKNFFYSDPLTSEYFGNLFTKDIRKFRNYYKVFINKTKQFHFSYLRREQSDFLKLKNILIKQEKFKLFDKNLNKSYTSKIKSFFKK